MADAVRCEACNKHDDRPPGNYNYPSSWQTLPAGWLRIGVIATNDPAVASEAQTEVCSWPCAAAWTADEAMKRDQPLTCDGCGKTMAEHGPLSNCYLMGGAGAPA